MTSSLQRQLAAINAKSTDQLNLKAQKTRHSQSLLFEPKEAATQKFDTIYQICSDGFTELCQLDRRFGVFAVNLFAEGSISVEREHMTAQENENLNSVVEQFLGLVSGRLLLRPAQKCVEWLVRRWKVHEYNPTPLVFSFLPYHDQDFFPTVLSLLPKKLPHALTFLRPYIASLAKPPRHVLASAAATNLNYLMEYTSFVLNAAQRKHQSSLMLGLWASIMAQAVNAMLDAAQVGRQEIRKQKMEDVMTKILPIIQDMLAIPASQELFLAACMIITLLVSRGELVDKAIDALMESVCNAWTPSTLYEGVVCIVLLGEEKTHARLPKSVGKIMIDTPGALTMLVEIQSRFESGKLVEALSHWAPGVIPQAKGDDSMDLDHARPELGDLQAEAVIVPVLSPSLDASPELRPREKVPSDRHLELDVQNATSYLELIEDELNAKKFPKDHFEVLKSHFKLLADIRSWQTSTGANFPYLQILALSNMTTILSRPHTPMNGNFMRADLIVDTLRSTTSPQVHHNALLLISKIATIAPDTILHSVMPLFTFMSSSTLRQADAYSAHVVSMTIESIVPPLVSSLKKKGKDLVAGASELLLSFTAAFEHIPSPRRVDTFVQLLKTLGPNDALHAISAMLIERYENDSVLNSTLQDIMSAFSVDTQLIALTHYLLLLSDACQKRRKQADTILGFQEKNAAEAHAAVRVLLDGFGRLVGSTTLRKKVAARFRHDDTADQVRKAYGNMLQLLVDLPNEEDGVINFDEPALGRAYGDALEALLHLLPLADFVSSSAALMQAGTETVRAKVFASLSARAAEAKNGDIAIASIFLESLPNCAIFLSPSQPLSVRLSALLCIDVICEKFGRSDREAVSSVVSTIAGQAALGSSATRLQTAAMLCLSSAVDVLGESFVSLSTNSVHTSLDHIQAGLRAETTDWALINAGFTFLNSLLESEAWLLASGGTLERAIVLACTAVSTGHVSSVVEGFCTTVAKKAKLSSLNTALLATFDDVLAAGPAAIARLVKIEHLVIQYHSKKDVLKHAQGFLDFMLRAFEIRDALDAPSERMQDDKQVQDVHNACQETTNAMLDLTLKLNDITFRPFFIQLSDLAKQNMKRAISLFDFAAALFEQLGSIMTSYAGFLLDDMALFLQNAEQTLNDPDGTILLDKVLSTLSASCSNDQDDFWTVTSHFEVIAGPLLDLMRRSDATQSSKASEAVVELAAAVSSSPELLKIMNTQIMAMLRDDHSSVRLVAIRCQRAITEKLSFDWLNMLPEMLPFISELLEDDNETVEREALKWVSQLEDVTGESLEGMLG